MLSHNVRYGLLAVLLAAGACAGSPRPQVNVIGVSPARDHDATRMLVVFVEVQNPTKRPIELSRLQYRLEAEQWFDAAGNIPLDRSVSPGASAVLEIPVHFESDADPDALGAEIAYRLQGTLFVTAGSREARWPVRAKGAIHAVAGSGRSAYAVVPITLQ